MSILSIMNICKGISSAVPAGQQNNIDSIPLTASVNRAPGMTQRPVTARRYLALVSQPHQTVCSALMTTTPSVPTLGDPSRHTGGGRGIPRRPDKLPPHLADSLAWPNRKFPDGGVTSLTSTLFSTPFSKQVERGPVRLQPHQLMRAARQQHHPLRGGPLGRPNLAGRS